MAANTTGLQDEDGEASDWIEIHNASTGAVNLGGWFLTDTPGWLTRWRFPATNLAPDSFILVFASGKDRALPGRPLHTNFRLNQAGGCLALIQPDGVTVASAFAAYPPQVANVSFGVGLGPSYNREWLVGSNAPLKYLVPAAPVPEAWRGGAPFDDSTWSNGLFRAGFDLSTGAVTVAYATPTNTVGNQAFGGALGLDFVVTRPVLVTELGCFDSAGDGLASTITVQLWRRNDNGTPDNPADDTGSAVLAATNFTAASPGTLTEGNRFKPLGLPLTLSNGAYTIVAYGYSATELLMNNLLPLTLNSGGGALQLAVQSRYGSAGAFPSTTDGASPHYGAGTFRFRALPSANFSTSLLAMRGVNASALFRVPFSVSPGGGFSSLALNLTCNDGFVAWLNGVELARRNAPDALAYNSTATTAATLTESLDVSGGLNSLNAATNLLAIQGLNLSAGDASFFVDATLSAQRFATQQVFFTSPTPAAPNTRGLLFPGVVINEIHSNPTNSKSFPAEFIELYNPLPTSVDLSGWAFTQGVHFTFPAGTALAAGGYLVLAGNPAMVQQVFHVAALGPWTGSLANDGDTLQLDEASGAVADRVSYGLGFPWPTVGDAPGRSMQLLHEGLDRNLGGSWRSGPPTPGARNAVATSAVPPQIHQVNHTPAQPASGQGVVITAKVTDPDGVASVTLDYQVVEPGGYLRLTDAAYTTNWTSLALHDDGLNGDAVPFDSVYSAQIPASVQTHRRLIRYRLNATDRQGNAVRVPYPDDPSPNFAYFVYDGVPAWTGAVQPGVTPAQTFDTNTLRKVRAYQLISQSNDVWNCQFNPAYNGQGYIFEGAVVMDGVVYDHAHYEVVGQNSTYVTGKNKWRFRFGRGHWLRLRDDYGSLLSTKRETLKLSALTEPWATWNRGLAGLDEALMFRLNNLVGVPAQKSAYLQLRVIAGAAEAPANQYAGDLWGLYLGFEVYDQEFKQEHGLPDGNLFYMQGSGGANNLGAQGAGQPDDLSDLNGFISGVTGYNASPAQPLDWWRANVDLLAYYSWRAVIEAVNDNDKRDQENVTYFHDPNTGLWSIHPWDEDLLYEQFDRWGPQGTQAPAALEQIRKCLEIPALNTEFQNRARELQDLLLNRDQAGKLIDELLSIVTDGGPSQPGFVEVDRRRWDYNPGNGAPGGVDRPWGNFYRTPFPISNMGNGPFPQPFSRTLTSADFPGQVAWVKNFIASDPHGGARLAALAADPSIPGTPALSYAGAPGFPADGLRFQTTPFSSPGTRGFAAIQWRLGEVCYPGVSNFVAGVPWRYEIQTVWATPELAAFSSDLTIPASYVVAGRSYRVRAKFKDTAGCWSHWSAPVEFLAGTPASALLARDLVVSEIMYDPPAFGGLNGDAFEFLELQNVGAGTLDLSGLLFTAGITFTFTNGTLLGPGATFLLARDAAGLALKHPGVVVHGFYGGKLNNAGETLTLAQPAGPVVFSFAYGTQAPWPAAPHGLGFSLVLAHPGPGLNLASPAAWRASSSMGGSPGANDPAASIPPLRVNEVLSHGWTNLDFIELFNPTSNRVDLSGWCLTDDPAVPAKYRIPADSWIGPLGYAVFDESLFNATPGTNGSFGLSSTGDSVYLFSGDANTNLTGYSHGFTFAAAAVGVSFGRYVNSVGEEQFPPQTARTPGAPNAGPKVGPVVISEIQYHPAAGTDEFIELRNLTANAVALSDPANPQNTWRLNGVGYDFPTNLSLASQECMLLVATNPAAFRAKYSVAASVPIVGPYPGRLQGGGERLELQRPELDPTNGLVYITVDTVRYSGQPPWPTGAGGFGPSLQRRDPGLYGDDPTNWLAAVITPGADLIFGQAPSIVQQPQSQSLLVGQAATFSVIVTGTPPFSYQWNFGGTPIAGSVGPSLVLTNLQLAQAGDYLVQVFSPSGSTSSAPAHLAVVQPVPVAPVIVQQPLSQATVAGANVILSVSVTNTATLPVTYRWRRNNAAWVTNVLSERSCFVTVTNAQLPATNFNVIVANTARPSGFLSSNAYLTYLADADGDGLPDAWTTRYFGHPTGQAADLSRPQDDADGDGLLNWQEYVAGTDPKDPSSYLRVDAGSANGGTTVVFGAVSNRTYTLLFTDALGASWSRLAELAARATNHLEILPDAPATPQRYYRVVTPRQP